MFLTAEEIFELTHRQRCKAQARALEGMGIPFRRRLDGTIAVLRVHVETIEGHRDPADRLPAEPQLME